MHRRETIKWMLAAASLIPLRLEAADYGTDPNLQRVYHPGELWPLTLNGLQKKQTTLLCDTIIPADATSPAASAVGVVEFVDEWISAPYPAQQKDREAVLNGLAWMDSEAQRRFSHPLLDITTQQLQALCDDICFAPKAKLAYAEGVRFFSRFRDLTTGGFYTTPQGRADLRYVGNTPLPRFDGPPLEVLKKAGLA